MLNVVDKRVIWYLLLLYLSMTAEILKFQTLKRKNIKNGSYGKLFQCKFGLFAFVV